MTAYKPGDDIRKMIEKYIAGTATEEEMRFVELYYAYSEKNTAPELSEEEKALSHARNFEEIQRQIRTTRSARRSRLWSYKYAAAALLILTAPVAYLSLKKQDKFPGKGPLAIHVNDILPGSNKALLTLADGTKVVLDDKAAGKVIEIPGLTVTKTKNGQLVYTVSGKQAASRKIASNTVATPRGGQYQVILPDGTRVWLNASSSLSYPELFSGNKRTVRLTGEGYFEVAKNKAMPFHVETAAQDVEVTGTHFNINAYMDEPALKTTLLEGSVNVHYSGKTKTLQPGQQSRVFGGSPEINIATVNTEEETAWKNGLFQFSNASLKSILNQVERWYDVKVDYSTVPNKHYNGMVPRSAGLSEVLHMLEVTGNISFKIEKNRELKVITRQGP
ncbi:FecR domain-containing protein [Pedobacter sp. N36a]|uniref:FecR family protein n=1 Tax=Pedobacter sp. N36a TaxID=2767996 RepID=UPI0016571BF2|nr:FecR family protein [Pedobacter sp. N36a]MBC8988441.1 FecR domain-containing protein [Pedobacter sp. N36a]